MRLSHDWFDRDLPDNVSFGDRSWLHSSFAFLHYQSAQPAGLTVGHDTGLYIGTFFDLGPHGEVRIGDFSTLVSVIISTNARVTIGSYVFVAHDVVIADRDVAIPGADAPEPAGITIEDDVWIGAKVVILGGAHIVRVHDVAEMLPVIHVADSILRSRREEE